MGTACTSKVGDQIGKRFLEGGSWFGCMVEGIQGGRKKKSVGGEGGSAVGECHRWEVIKGNQ